MPKALHKKLVRQARKKGLKGRAKDRYVFGTLNRATRRSSRDDMVASLMKPRRG